MISEITTDDYKVVSKDLKQQIQQKNTVKKEIKISSKQFKRNTESKQQQLWHNQKHQQTPVNKQTEINALYQDFFSIELIVGQIQETWNVNINFILAPLFLINLYALPLMWGSEVREIASGLRQFLPQNEFDGQCIVFKNLKPKNVLGFQSNGMILTVANSDYTKVEILRPPQESGIGERVMILGMEQYFNTNFERLTLKGKTWLKTQPHLLTDEHSVANFNGKQLITTQGPIKTKSLLNCSIS